MDDDTTIDIFTKIRGISYYQRSTKWCKPGVKLIVIREPKNRHDFNAVRLCVDGGVLFKKQRCLGYLSRDLAEQFAPLMDEGLKIKVVVSQRTGKRNQIRGVNVLMSYSKAQSLAAQKAIEKKFFAERARQISQLKQIEIDAEQKEIAKRERSVRRKDATKASIVTIGKAIKYVAYRIGDGDPIKYNDRDSSEQGGQR